MALKGVRQLKELVIRYSDYDGSSLGVRNWMRESLVSFAEKNPELTVKTVIKRAVHPIVTGVYRNGNTKTICVKNLPPEDVYNYILDLRNQIGRRVSLYLLSYLALIDVILDEFYRIQATCS